MEKYKKSKEYASEKSKKIDEYKKSIKSDFDFKLD